MIRADWADHEPVEQLGYPLRCTGPGCDWADTYMGHGPSWADHLRVPDSPYVLDVQRLEHALWNALSDQRVLRIHVDGWKELHDVATSVAQEYEKGRPEGQPFPEATCGDPEHPLGAYCTVTTGLHTCYPPALSAPLDAAWAAAEAALPEGYILNLHSMLDGSYMAAAHSARVGYPKPSYGEDADTPVAALLALAEKLRESQP